MMKKKYVKINIEMYFIMNFKKNPITYLAITSLTAILISGFTGAWKNQANPIV